MEYFFIAILLIMISTLLFFISFFIYRKIKLNKQITNVINDVKNIHPNIVFDVINNQLVMKVGSVNYLILFIPAKPHYEISFNSPTVVQLFRRVKYRKITIENNYNKNNENNEQILIVVLNNKDTYRRYINESDLEIVTNGDTFWNITVSNPKSLNDVLSNLIKQ